METIIFTPHLHSEKMSVFMKILSQLFFSYLSNYVSYISLSLWASLKICYTDFNFSKGLRNIPVVLTNELWLLCGIVLPL